MLLHQKSNPEQHLWLPTFMLVQAHHLSDMMVRTVNNTIMQSYASLLLLAFWNRLLNQISTIAHICINTTPNEFQVRFSHASRSIYRLCLLVSLWFDPACHELAGSVSKADITCCYLWRISVFVYYIIAHERSRCLRFESAMAVVTRIVCRACGDLC
jgi:hypothetical protein